MKDVFRLTSSGLPEDTLVVGFRGVEGLSKPYLFEIHATIGHEEEDFDPADAVGSRATLVIDREDGRPPFRFHGVFSTMEIVHELSDRTLIRAALVPRFAMLAQSFHSRVFTDSAVPEILKAVLSRGGFGPNDYALKLAGDYRPEEHVCQYRESDLDFLSRWMEREGLYYHFEQDDDREVLIVTDHRSYHTKLLPDPVSFFSLAGADVTAQESLCTFTSRHRSLPGAVRVRDSDHLKPKLDVSGSAAVSPMGLGEISVHGDRFFTPEQGARLARLRGEELKAREVVFQGSGSALYLRSGYLFELSGHPRPSFDAEYLITDAEHQGNQAATTPEMLKLTGLDAGEVYRVNVTAIPASVQFRAERRAAWPRIYGHESGVVDGPAESEYAQIDRHGRYKVKLMFDESGLGGGKASTWVRMLQPHGGTVEGWHFPLRKGTEVLLTFLGGDPDRPVIAGVVPNALAPSPVTGVNHTQNVIQTGGRNRVEMEDRAGQERITVSTPHKNTTLLMGDPHEGHELIARTDGNALIATGANHDVRVKGHLDERVRGNVSQLYEGSKVQEVGGTLDTLVRRTARQQYNDDRHVSVQQAYTMECAEETRTVRGTRTTRILGDNCEAIEGDLCVTIEKNIDDIHVKGDVDEIKVDGNATVNIEGELEVCGKKGVKIEADDGDIDIIAADKTVTIEGDTVDIIRGQGYTWSESDVYMTGAQLFVYGAVLQFMGYAGNVARNMFNVAGSSISAYHADIVFHKFNYTNKGTELTIARDVIGAIGAYVMPVGSYIIC